jgi:biotin operon repressor
MIMGRPNKYRKKLYKLIKASPNGITTEELAQEVNCTKQNIWYNLDQLRKTGKIIGPKGKKKKYYLKKPKKTTKNNHTFLEGIDFLKDDSSLKIVGSYISHLYGYQKDESFIKFKMISKKEKVKFMKKNRKKIDKFIQFEKQLINSLEVSIGPRRVFFPLHIKEILKKRFLKILSDLMGTPDFVNNLDNFSNVNLNLTINFGEELRETINSLGGEELNDILFPLEIGRDTVDYSEKRENIKKLKRKYIFRLDDFCKEKNIPGELKGKYKQIYLKAIEDIRYLKYQREKKIKNILDHLAKILKKEIECRLKASNPDQEKKVIERGAKLRSAFVEKIDRDFLIKYNKMRIKNVKKN